MDEITRAHFESQLGEVFSVRLDDDATIPLTLLEVSSPAEHIVRQAREAGRREPFSLLFSAPAHPFLPQGTYHLSHPAIQSVAAFLVPVAQTERGYSYEAVFA